MTENKCSEQEVDDSGLFTELSDEPDAVDPDNVELANPAKSRNWLYIGLICLLFAVLFRLLLSPVIDVQKQRQDQAANLYQQAQLATFSADQAMTAAGDFDRFETHLTEMRYVVERLVLPQNTAGKVANRIFGNIPANIELSTRWDDFRRSSEQLLERKSSIAALKQTITAMNSDIDTAATETMTFIEAVAKEGRTQEAGNGKDRYLYLTSESANISGVLSRMQSGLQDFYLSDTDLTRESDTQNAQLVRLKDTLNRIVGNSAAMVATASQPLQSRFERLEASLIDLSNATPSVIAAREDLQRLKTRSTEFEADTQKAGQQTNLVGILDTAANVVPLLLLALGMFSMWRFANLQSEYLVRNESSLSDAIPEQQESILKLLDDLRALADGDLTVEADVTNQLTGAIADSVNFVVKEMRELVGQINRVSTEVVSESERAVGNAQTVFVSSKSQAELISSAAGEMQRLTESMHEMSSQAEQSSEMARESSLAASDGAKAVRDTIAGVEGMREQIQETSKRIKRLGESSQRIGDAVALIDDIAEQSSILSLNAAIQASIAGEAGRGFAVISDEVQSLAELSSEANRKIAELMGIIQTDTNDAVASIEKATHQVVSGTRVTDSAGDALLEIERTSQQLSERVKNIANRSNQQADVVTDVTEKVNEVDESSIDTSQKAQDSANLISRLLTLAKELEASVARFKLPAA